MFLSVFTVSKIFEKPGAGNARVFLNSGSVFYFDSHSVATEIDNTSRQCRIVLSTRTFKSGGGGHFLKIYIIGDIWGLILTEMFGYENV